MARGFKVTKGKETVFAAENNLLSVIFANSGTGSMVFSRGGLGDYIGKRVTVFIGCISGQESRLSSWGLRSSSGIDVSSYQNVPTGATTRTNVGGMVGWSYIITSASISLTFSGTTMNSFGVAIA